MDDINGHDCLAEIFHQCFDRGGHGGPRGGGEFHLDRHEFSTGLDQEIDLPAGGGSPEIDLRIDSGVHEGLDDFREYRRFHDRPAHGAGSRMFRIFQPRQVAQRPDIRKIDLWLDSAKEFGRDILADEVGNNIGDNRIAVTFFSNTFFDLSEKHQ